jgi:hypothetical protein
VRRYKIHISIHAYVLTQGLHAAADVLSREWKVYTLVSGVAPGVVAGDKVGFMGPYRPR